METPNDKASEANSPGDIIIGDWKSSVRQTKNGAMAFSFHFGADRVLDVTGTPVSGSHAEVYRRTGPYQHEGEKLVSPAVNEGRPVQVRTQGNMLILTIDESLVFRLRRT